MTYFGDDPPPHCPRDWGVLNTQEGREFYWYAENAEIAVGYATSAVDNSGGAYNKDLKHWYGFMPGILLGIGKLISELASCGTRYTNSDDEHRSLVEKAHELESETNSLIGRISGIRSRDFWSSAYDLGVQTVNRFYVDDIRSANHPLVITICMALTGWIIAGTVRYTLEIADGFWIALGIVEKLLN